MSGFLAAGGASGGLCGVGALQLPGWENMNGHQVPSQQTSFFEESKKETHFRVLCFCKLFRLNLAQHGYRRAPTGPATPADNNRRSEGVLRRSRNMASCQVVPHY